MKGRLVCDARGSGSRKRAAKCTRPENIVHKKLKAQSQDTRFFFLTGSLTGCLSFGVFSFPCSCSVCPVANACVRSYELEDELSGDGVLARSNKEPTKSFNH